MRDGHAVVDHGCIAGHGGTDAVLHFLFIEHTPAAVHHQGVPAHILGEIPAGGEIKGNGGVGELADPFGQLLRADIAALAVVP